MEVVLEACWSSLLASLKLHQERAGIKNIKILLIKDKKDFEKRKSIDKGKKKEKDS